MDCKTELLYLSIAVRITMSSCKVKLLLNITRNSQHIAQSHPRKLCKSLFLGKCSSDCTSKITSGFLALVQFPGPNPSLSNQKICRKVLKFIFAKIFWMTLSHRKIGSHWKHSLLLKIKNGTLSNATVYCWYRRWWLSTISHELNLELFSQAGWSCTATGAMLSLQRTAHWLLRVASSTRSCYFINRGID